MRKQQIKKAIRLIRIAYNKAVANYAGNSLFISQLLQDYWLKYEGGIKPDDSPF